MYKPLLLMAIISSVCVSKSLAQTQLTYGDLVARLYDLKRLAEPPLPGEQAGNFSSFNRGSRYNNETGEYEQWQTNWDGGGAVRREGDSLIAAEINGPGVIWRFWSASAGKGHLKIFIDAGEQPALDIPYQDFMNNEQGMFAYPELVLTMSKGKNSFVPIPFQKSCKVVFEKGWGAYYQITYSRFPKGTITTGLTMGPDYGIFDVLLDGKPLKEGIDLYSPNVTPSPRQDLGRVELSPGTHQLTFRLTGRNEQAKHIQDKLLMLGIDYIALVPVE